MKFLRDYFIKQEEVSFSDLPRAVRSREDVTGLDAYDWLRLPTPYGPLWAADLHAEGLWVFSDEGKLLFETAEDVQVIADLGELVSFNEFGRPQLANGALVYGEIWSTNENAPVICFKGDYYIAESEYDLFFAGDIFSRTKIYTRLQGILEPHIRPEHNERIISLLDTFSRVDNNGVVNTDEELAIHKEFYLSCFEFIEKKDLGTFLDYVEQGFAEGFYEVKR